MRLWLPCFRDEAAEAWEPGLERMVTRGYLERARTVTIS